MAQMDQKNKGVLGNTEKPPKRISASKRWCFTLNNYTDEEYLTLLHNLDGSSFIVGKEIGESGTPHLQGYVEFKDKRRMSENKVFNKRIHWEQSKGTRDQNIDYCTKDNDYFFIGFKINKKKQVKILKEEQLYKWQRDIIALIKTEPDDRTIHWFWEPTGNRGKTTFIKYLCQKFNAVPLEGKKNDILYCAAMFESDVYVFDIERSMEDYVSYAALEKIKNGVFMCSKYESKPVIRNCPHVIIFANFPPDEDELSKDRWKITKL